MDYLGRFGDRCMDELKLETKTLRDDPSFLIQMIRAYVAQGNLDPTSSRERELGIRQQAEALAFGRLGGPKKSAFSYVLRQTRARVRDRENLRFERTRVFGVVRRLFMAIGQHFVRAGKLEHGDDILYLTKEEIFGHLDGVGLTQDLRALVLTRRCEFESYKEQPPPPDRFETSGPPGEAALPEEALTTPAAAGADLSGVGCCPGVVRAPVRVVRDPREARDLTGRILVAERTDPGWTLLFPAVAGLLVQRGSLLSHSAIVAREMGLPCVVGISGLLSSLVDGDVVEMNGTTGVIRRLESASEGQER